MRVSNNVRHNYYEREGVAANRLSLVIGFVVAVALAAVVLGPVQHKMWELMVKIYSM